MNGPSPPARTADRNEEPPFAEAGVQLHNFDASSNGMGKAMTRPGVPSTITPRSFTYSLPLLAW
jgi:hypothetical protein